MTGKMKNIPLIVALSIPVFMVLIIVVSIYVPTVFVNPQYDFIYSMGDDYCQEFRYIVRQDKIVKRELERPAANCAARHTMSLYYYDVSKDYPQEITYEEAKRFTVDGKFVSPDGFEIAGGDNYGWFFSGGSSYYDKYLKKGACSRKIFFDRNYYYSFKLLGWVKEDYHG